MEILGKNQPIPTEIVAQGGALCKLENNTQMTVAIQRPREETAILQNALTELDTYRSAAIAAVYNKPAGKDDSGRQVMVTGLSIRAAESLAGRWSNSSYGTEIVTEDNDAVTIAAVFLDYEHNTRHAMTRRVSKVMIKRDKTKYRLEGDRLDQHVQAQMSKLLREVILRSLPAGLKSDYMEKALEIVKKLGPDNLAKIEKAFAKHGVKKQDLETHLGKPLSKMDGEDYAELQGIFNAIETGEIAASEAFDSVTTKKTVGDAMKEKSEKPVEKPAEKPAEKTAETKTETTQEKGLPEYIGSIMTLKEKLGLANGLFAAQVGKAMGRASLDTTTWTLEEAKKVFENLSSLAAQKGAK